MFIIKRPLHNSIISENRKENFVKSLIVSVMLTGSVFLDANLPVTTSHSQYDTVEARLFGWQRNSNITRAYAGGKVVYTERLKIFGITIAIREREVQL